MQPIRDPWAGMQIRASPNPQNPLPQGVPGRMVFTLGTAHKYSAANGRQAKSLSFPELAGNVAHLRRPLSP